MNRRIAIVTKALATQNLLNQKLHDRWVIQGWDYGRAIWTEAAEAIGHMNVFWWKKGTYEQPLTPTQREQLQMELVDILHFGLSLKMVEIHSISEWTVDLLAERIAIDLLDGFVPVYEEEPPPWQAVDAHCAHRIEIVAKAGIGGKFDVRAFGGACEAAGLTFESLFALYFSKVTLNKFRWRNGYNLPKDDKHAYSKLWPTKEGKLVEDNEILVQVSKGMIGVLGDSLLDKVHSGAYESELYEALQNLYPGPQGLKLISK